MANLFKRAALAFGRFTGLRHEPADAHLALIGPVAEAMQEQADFTHPDACVDPSAIDTSLPTGDAAGGETPWGEAMASSLDSTESSAAAASGNEGELVTASLNDSEALPVLSTITEDVKTVEAETFSTQAIEAAAVAPAPVVCAAEEVKAEEVKPPIELKPEPIAEPRSPKPSVSFTQLYELISNEVNKRNDSTIASYERLMSASRAELDAARKQNRIAWSVGGVMTAVVTLGGIWATAEVAATHVEVGGLRQQVSVGAQAVAERDRLRDELLKTREASAKIELEMLKARLDQAVIVTAERDRLRDELDVARKARLETEAELRNELRLARAATTQPVSAILRQAADKAVAQRNTAIVPANTGAERPDVWSVLLNGRDGQ
jgi:hypothetical protein